MKLQWIIILAFTIGGSVGFFVGLMFGLTIGFTKAANRIRQGYKNPVVYTEN